MLQLLGLFFFFFITRIKKDSYFCLYFITRIRASMTNAFYFVDGLKGHFSRFSKFKDLTPILLSVSVGYLMFIRSHISCDSSPLNAV